MDKNIEQKISQAIDHATPDMWESILSRCREQKGSVIIMEEKKNRNNWTKKIIGIAAAFVLLVGGAVGTGTYINNFAVDSTISLDVIINSIRYDLGYLGGWGIGSMLYSMADGYNVDLTSQYKKIDKVVTKTLERTITKLESALAEAE